MALHLLDDTFGHRTEYTPGLLQRRMRALLFWMVFGSSHKSLELMQLTSHFSSCAITTLRPIDPLHTPLHVFQTSDDGTLEQYTGDVTVPAISYYPYVLATRRYRRCR